MALYIIKITVLEVRRPNAMDPGDALVRDDDAAKTQSLLRNTGCAETRKRYTVCVAMYESLLRENGIDPHNVDKSGARDRQKEPVGLRTDMELVRTFYEPLHRKESTNPNVLCLELSVST